jgi:hypothetical protein
MMIRPKLTSMQSCHDISRALLMAIYYHDQRTGRQARKPDQVQGSTARTRRRCRDAPSGTAGAVQGANTREGLNRGKDADTGMI